MVNNSDINCGVYRITHFESGREYVGSSGDIRKRMRLHKKQLVSNKHHSPYLQRVFNKYGEDSFSVEVLVACEVKDLLFYEQKILDTFHPEFNVSKNASGPIRCGQKLSEEHVRKVRDSVIDRYKNGFKVVHPPRSDEYRASVSEKSKENWANSEIREKNTIAIQKAMTEEECHKRSIRTKALWEDPEYREKSVKSRKGKAYNKGYKCTPDQVENRRRNARIHHTKRRFGDNWKVAYVELYPEHSGDVNA